MSYDINELSITSSLFEFPISGSYHSCIRASLIRCMVHTRKQKQQKMDSDHLTRFMERSEQHMKEMMEAIATLNQKYDQLSTSVQRMEAESSDRRTIGGVQGGAPPPPAHNHEPEYNSGTGHNHEQQRGDNSIHTWALRLDFPHFDGGDPSGWLYRAEQFFEYHQTQATQ
jgi:hypothetical protein